MRDRHRIVMHLDHDYPDGLSREALQAIVGAVLRHELEHASQWEVCAHELFGIHDSFILPAMGKAFGGLIPHAYINMEPVELDANAAAAAYVREHHPDVLDEIAATTNKQNLVRSALGPQDRKTLMDRMVAFLFLFREAAESNTGELEVDAYLGACSPEAAATWRRFCREGADTPYPGRPGGSA